MYLLRSSGVRRSTLLPPRRAESSRSSRASPKKPTTAPGSNSTSTSISLSGRKSGRMTDPKSERRRILCCAQNSAIRSLQISIAGVMWRPLSCNKIVQACIRIKLSLKNGRQNKRKGLNIWASVRLVDTHFKVAKVVRSAILDADGILTRHSRWNCEE